MPADRSPNQPARWDIFCAVVDNFGDIGVCWRLARQLACEHGLAVRLWVDDLNSFRHLHNAVDPTRDAQRHSGVEVRRWPPSFPQLTPADVVIETFGCSLPDNYLAAMCASDRRPVWINLEYLSAESWVDDYHALPSPHPQLPLTKYYFFPGFTSRTGGLLREQGVTEQRQAFQRSVKLQSEFWQSIDLPMKAPDEFRVSLFCYENAGLAELLQAWASGEERITCLVPAGNVRERLAALFTSREKIAPQIWRRGNLEVRGLPFLDQSDFDRLLWACDFNFVRGEDSFVRAQWAARPFVWHIYPQQESAHWVKLNAFIDHYCAALPLNAAAGLRQFWRAWNSGRGSGDAWTAFLRHRSVLEVHAEQWSRYLLAHRDLASNLVEFSSNLLK
ncbi:MAG: elongation factor P maturation arginine rhamnosyltransferase EarP [Burkholderiales bacterium]|nr:elongation factor P maturation arginine rhamnosyltransferase EarP [Burkholderiales bacterium]